MHPAPCLNHEWLQPRPILTSFARLCISTCSSGYRARMMRPRHVTRRRTGHSHVNDKFRTIREQFDVTSLAMTSFAVQSRLGRNNSNFFQCIQRVCKQISNRIVPLDDPSLPRPAVEPMKWLVFQTHPVHDVTTLHVLQSLKIQGSIIYYKPSFPWPCSRIATPRSEAPLARQTSSARAAQIAPSISKANQCLAAI